MKTYIAKQPKQVRERIEVKLHQKLVEKLERYCEYLESDRDYVISQVLELAFKKDKGFVEWLRFHAAETVPTARPETRKQ